MRHHNLIFTTHELLKNRILVLIIIQIAEKLFVFEDAVLRQFLEGAKRGESCLILPRL